MGIERGCGVREPGGIYLESMKCTPEARRAGRCRPVEHFLYDPPLPVGIDVPNRGVLIVERPDGSGIHDVWDRVGESGYPNAADMVEEIKRFGLSRRASKGLDFSLLGPGSLILLIHPRAIIANAADLYAYLVQEREETAHHTHDFRCPCARANHAALPDSPVPQAAQETCAGLWWETLAKAEPVYDLAAPRRSCVRKSGSTTYSGYSTPHEFKPVWQEGIFARFPIGNLAIINDPEGGQDVKAAERVSGTHLPVIFADE
mgnify:CR=1 FL=1